MDRDFIMKWIKCAGIRALKSAAQGVLAAVGGAYIFSEVNWGIVLSTAGLSAVASLLTTIITGLPEVNEPNTKKKWIVAALIRAGRTVAQVALATIGSATMWGDVNWSVVISASLLAGGLSIVTSLAGIPEAEAPVKGDDHDNSDDN